MQILKLDKILFSFTIVKKNRLLYSNLFQLILLNNTLCASKILLGFLRGALCNFSVRCVTFVPSSSSGATKLAANFNTVLTRFADPSTASLTALTGSDAILVRLPGASEREKHLAVQPPSWSRASTTICSTLKFRFRNRRYTGGQDQS